MGIAEKVKFWPIIFIVLLWLVFAFPYLVKGFVPFPSDYLVSFFPPWSATFGMPVKNNAMPDVITQIFPWKTVTIDSWKLGQVPLWNPYSFSGTPHAANYQTAAFSPFNVLFFLFDRVDAWSILILLQPLLAGWFMYIFLRNVNRSKSGSLVGSISYMFCGFLVTWMSYGTLGYAALFLPLVLLAIHRSLASPTWWSFPLISIGIALSFVSGHFQISLYVLLASLMYVIWHARASKIKQLFLALLFIALGLLLAAPQLLPSYDAYAASVRSAIFLKGEIIPWNYLITFFSPDFYGNPVTRNDWFGHYAEWAGFAGVIPFMLALFALLPKREPAVWFFAGLSVMSLLFALPTPLTDALFALKVPVLSTSAASRIILLASFGIAALSSFGLDALRDDWKKKKTLQYARFMGVLASGALLFWIVLQFGHILPEDKLAIARRNSLLPTAMVTAGLITGFAGFITKLRMSRFLLGALVLLAAFDQLRFATKWIPYASRQYVYPRVPVLSFLQKNAPYERAFANFGGEVIPFGTRSIEGYDALYQNRYGRFITSADDGKLKNSERSVVLLGKKAAYAQRVLDLLGVKYLVHRLSDGRNVWAYPHWEYPQYQSVYKDDHYEVFENKTALPRFLLASEYQIVAGDQEAIDTLFSGTFNPKETVLLETKPTIEPKKGKGDVRITKDTPNELLFEVNADSPKVLFVSDTFDPGWRATVDGVTALVYRANYDFRAVGVPAGSHTVRMYYWPESFTLGLGLFGVGSLVIAGWVVKVLYENRHL